MKLWLTLGIILFASLSMASTVIIDGVVKPDATVTITTGGGPQPIPCTSWDCSVWTSCTAGIQTCVSAVGSPLGCTGSPPIITRPCDVQPSPCGKIGENCSSQLAGAVSLNIKVCDSGVYGYAWRQLPAYHSCPIPYQTTQTEYGRYTVPAGATVWFLVDASSMGLTGSIVISLLDYAQGGTGGAPQASIYPLDASNNIVPWPGKSGTSPYQMSLPYGQGSSPSVPVGYRYLLKVTEAGAGVPLMIIYK